MPWFKCFMEGENFPAAFGSNGKSLMGFYATRWVEASDANSAEFAAVHLLRAEYRHVPPPETWTPDAKVFVTEITEVAGCEGVNSGATWYEMDEG